MPDYIPDEKNDEEDIPWDCDLAYPVANAGGDDFTEPEEDA